MRQVHGTSGEADVYVGFACPGSPGAGERPPPDLPPVVLVLPPQPFPELPPLPLPLLPAPPALLLPPLPFAMKSSFAASLAVRMDAFMSDA